MQDETQNPNADAAREPSAPDPSAANPVEAEGLNQDTVAPDSAVASTPTDQGANAFDPRVTTRPEDLTDPASPTDPAASAEPVDRGPLGTPPPGTAEQEGPPPPADELEPDDAASATDWGNWRGAGDHSDTGEVVSGGSEPSDFWEDWTPFGDSDPSEGTGVVSEPTAPEAVSMPTDKIVDPIPTDQVEEPLEPEAAATSFPEAVSMPHDMIVDPGPGVMEEMPYVTPDLDDYEPTGVIPDSEAATPPPLNLADQIDPNWPVLEELNGREYREVEEVLEDPSKLSDPEVLENLNSDQMQAVMQAFLGHLSTPETDVVGDPEVEYVRAPEAATQLPNLADQIDPNWPVLEELNGREYREVEEVLEDPSKLSDPEVLENLNSDQMQAVMQAMVGHLTTPETGAVGDPEDGGEVYEPGTGAILDYEPGPGVILDAEAGGEVFDPAITTTSADLGDTSGPGDAEDATGASEAAVGGAAVGGAAVGAGAVGGFEEDISGILGDIFGGDSGELVNELVSEGPGGFLGDLGLGETVEDLGEAFGVDADDVLDFGLDLLGVDVDAGDISEIAQDPFGAVTEAAGDVVEGYIDDIPVIGDIVEGDIGEAVLGGLGVSVGGPLGGVIGEALGEVAEDIIEEVPVVGDVFEAVEGVTEGLSQAAEEVVDEAIEDVGEAAEDLVEDVGDFIGGLF